MLASHFQKLAPGTKFPPKKCTASKNHFCTRTEILSDFLYCVLKKNMETTGTAVRNATPYTTNHGVLNSTDLQFETIVRYGALRAFPANFGSTSIRNSCTPDSTSSSSCTATCNVHQQIAANRLTSSCWLDTNRKDRKQIRPGPARHYSDRIQL